MKTYIVLLGMMISVLACDKGSVGSMGSDEDRIMSSKEMAPSMEEGQSSGGQADAVQVTEQKVIRSGFVTVKVNDALKSKKEVETIIAKHKAYIGNEQFDNTDYNATYHMQIRVPAENLDAFVADLESIDGEVTNKSINANDVTEEYMDLETRLTNKRAYLEQYRELLKNARTIEDILKVREQLRILEEEIESAEGRLKYLKNQVSLSTIQLTLLQEKDFVYRPDRKINFFERLKDSMAAGWYGFVDFCIRLIGIWPFWLVLILIIWLIRKYTRRKNPVVPPSGPISNS